MQKDTLFAPNGKPSNLTPEQWKLVRTPEFKAWFGDWENDPKNASRVVDENGEPLVMYHGSPYDFSVFETNEIESDRNDRDFKSRFWFIVDKNWADNYSKSRSTPTQKTYKVFLNIRNPKYDFNLYADDDNDGSIEFRDKKVWVAIATLSNQIKLADGTNTTFDNNNPDIRFSKGGQTNSLVAPNGKPSNLTPEQYRLVRTPEFKAWFGDWEKLILTKLNDSGIDEVSLKRLEDGVSKVVDSNGEPLVVWHGTKKNFTIFGGDEKLNQYLPEYRSLYNWKKNTNYFHKDKEYSETFGSKYGGQDKPYFLNVKNLIKTETTDDIEDIGYWKNIYDYYVEDFGADGVYDGFGQYATLVSPNQIKLADGTNTTFDANNDDTRYAKGGRTISQTPAPNKDRIYGSLLNTKKSASNLSSAERIAFSESTMKIIEEKVQAHNESNPKKQITIESAKAVVRRGMGAYSNSHRPTISGGKPNSRVAWGLARLNAFIYKILNGKSKSGKYTQDDDLIKELGYTVSRFDKGGKTDIPTRFFGSQAGGVLIYCKSTERFLILLRSLHVLEPLTWGIISGKLDGSEDIEQTVRREAFEETGYDLPKLYPSYVFERPNFKFYNFLAVVNEEFVPDLNWENMGYAWVKLENMPDNLHFGLVELLKHGKIKSKLDQITKRFKRGNSPKL